MRMKAIYVLFCIFLLSVYTVLPGRGISKKTAVVK
jgi:hypothetical protein